MLVVSTMNDTQFSVKKKKITVNFHDFPFVVCLFCYF